MPTLFESDSFPVYEAWLDGVPVVCSNACSLPDQVLDAGILFDPHDTSSIAVAIAKLVRSVDLQDQLRKRGYRRVTDFDWERTAKAYRATYRQAAARELTLEERWLLQWDWMREPLKSREVQL